MCAARRKREPAGLLARRIRGHRARRRSTGSTPNRHPRRLPLAPLAQQSYTPKKFDLAGLQGISDNTLQVHFGLYEGYVKNTNLLHEQLAEQVAAGKAAGADPH